MIIPRSHLKEILRKSCSISHVRDWPNFLFSLQMIRACPQIILFCTRYIQFVEIADKDPWFVEGLRYTGEQIKVCVSFHLLLVFLFH